MAQASEELLIKIDIVDPDSANRINEISEELNHLKATQKDYEQAVKEGKQLTTEQGKEYVAIKARIADLNKEVNAHVKALQKENQEQKKNADSLNSMRAQLKDLIKAYDNMSKAERENAEIGGKQVAMINQLTDQIKELEEGTQRYQRNVGNYANSITKALASQVPVIGKVSGAMDMLKTSTGWIGIVIQGAVMLFGALQMAFKRTEGNADKLTGGLAKMKGLFVMMQQALEPLVKGLVDGFVVALDKALQAVGWLGEKLQQFLRFIRADEWANKLESFAEKTKETAEATSELAVAEEQLARKQREARKIQLEYQKQAELLRQQRDDETKSIEERMKINEQLNVVLQKQMDAELGIAKEGERVAKLNIKLNGETTESLDRLAEAQTNVADIEERITGQRSEYLSNLNSLRKEAEAMAKVVDDIYANMSNEDIVYKLLGKPEKVKLDEEEDEEIIDETSRLQEINNLRLQYEQMGFKARFELQKQNLDLERAQRIASGEDAVAIELWYQGELTRITAESYNERAKFVINTLKDIAEITGASAQFQKTIALAEVALNTGQAISAGIASAMATPFPANIGAILTTISAVISGIAQAKSAIKSANIPTAKFAQGGLVAGEGTGTSDSIPAMLSNGESVMTARATSTYSPILSALNTSVGGAPIGDSTKTKGTQQLIQQFADAVEQIQIQVAVTDINDGQARVAKIVDNSNF